MDNSVIPKIYFPQSLFFSKSIHLQIIHLLIRCYKTRFFLWKINNADRNDVSKQKTHTHNKHSKNGS